MRNFKQVELDIMIKYFDLLTAYKITISEIFYT